MTDNIVTAAFSGGRRTRTEHLWQYDYGQVLRITGLELPETFEVHFSNTRYRGAAKTSIGTAEAVSIPDEFLTSGADIYAWVFLHTGADDGETEYMIIIPVRRRAQPCDDTPTPQEQSTVTQAIAALNNGVTRAEAAADAAEQASSGIDQTVAAALREAKDSGEFDGPQGPQGVQGERGDIGPQGPKGDTGEVTTAQLLKAFPMDTVSGPIASFPDGADGIPVKSLVINIEPVQAGNGDPSPENVRPITGWMGCTINHSGADTSAPDTLNISWQSEAGTVYGGTLEVMTGELVIDRAMVTFDGSSDENWHELRVEQPGLVRNVWRCLNVMPHQISTRRGAVDGCVFNGAIIGDNSSETSDGDRITCRPTSYSTTIFYIFTPLTLNMTLDDIRDMLSTTPLQFCYPLAEAITYQITPQEVTTLLGVNNIWADTGDTSVEYYADPTRYIQKLTSSAEEDMIADVNIPSGQYFMVGNTLYQSTAAIAAGATISPGTNCVRTNLAAALNALQ